MFLLLVEFATPPTQVEPEVVGQPRVTIIIVHDCPAKLMLYKPDVVGVNTYSASSPP